MTTRIDRNLKPNNIPSNATKDLGFEPRIKSNDKNETQIEREGKPLVIPTKANSDPLQLSPADKYSMNNQDYIIEAVKSIKHPAFNIEYLRKTNQDKNVN